MQENHLIYGANSFTNFSTADNCVSDKFLSSETEAEDSKVQPKDILHEEKIEQSEVSYFK